MRLVFAYWCLHFRNVIEELRVVKNDAPNRYMVLLKFRTPVSYFECVYCFQEDTGKFYDAFNNTLYNDLESEICQLMFVSHVEVTNPSMVCWETFSSTSF